MPITDGKYSPSALLALTHQFAAPTLRTSPQGLSSIRKPWLRSEEVNSARGGLVIWRVVVHSDLALKMASDLFWTALLICLPILGLTMLVGLVISVLQVITQVQEVSLTFAFGGASEGLYKHLQDLDGNLRADPDASERAALMADQDHDRSEAATPADCGSASAILPA